MGQFSIMPIIRLVFFGIVLLSERILSENAVVGRWAQLLAIGSTIPCQKLEKGTLRYSKKIAQRTQAPSQKKSCAGETTKKDKRSIMVSTRSTPEKKTCRPPQNREAPPLPRPRPTLGPAVQGSLFVLYPMAAGTSAAAALHASNAQNEHLNNDDEEEAPPCQRRRVGTSHRDMPLAANDSLEGEGGIDEGTSRRDMPLALADDDLQEGEGGVEDVDDGEWMGSADLMEEVEEEVEKLMDKVGQGLGTAGALLSRGSVLALDDNDLFAHFFLQLATMSCPNIKCDCLEIVTTANARSAIAKYLTWFERRQKHEQEQDSIVFLSGVGMTTASGWGQPI
jgi:hypothetical protein